MDAIFHNDFYVKGDQSVQVPAHLHFGKFLLDKIKVFGDSVALENASTGEKVTYKELTQYAVDLAVSLVKLGVEHGEVVALGSEKRLMLVPTTLAVLFTGATYTPFDIYSGRTVFKHKLTITQPKFFICSKLFWDTYSDIIQNFESIKTVITLDDTPASAVTVKLLTINQYNVNKFEPFHNAGQNESAYVLYSSGTTGMPKGVKLSHLNCILNSLADEYKDESLKTALVIGEWYHNYDSFMTYKFLTLGKKIVYVDGHPTPEEILKAIEKCQVNIAFLIPSLVNIISKINVNHNYHVDSLQVIYSRSSPLHLKTVNRLHQRFPAIKNVLQGYGMTEAGELTSENWGSRGPRPGSVGTPSPGITMKIVSLETNEPVGPDERGEICLRGPVFMKGYIGISEDTYLDSHGFFKTGDLGYYDDDGYFYIIDRLKEIIKYDGNQVAPLELETILLLHSDVREVGVVGKPVKTFGEEPTAFVVTQPGSTITEKELVDFVAREVPPYMQLRGGVRFVQHIPKNPRGKILRRALKDILTTEDTE